MLRKFLSKSGRRLLRAIKKLSTRNRRAKKSQLISWHYPVPETETASFSWSLPSLDAKSIDTYMTYVADVILEDCDSSCCCCDEYEENQRNENKENEMIM